MPVIAPLPAPFVSRPARPDPTYATFDGRAGLLVADGGAPWFFEFKRDERVAVDDGFQIHGGPSVSLVLDTLESSAHIADEGEVQS